MTTIIVKDDKDPNQDPSSGVTTKTPTSTRIFKRYGIIENYNKPRRVIDFVYMRERVMWKVLESKKDYYDLTPSSLFIVSSLIQISKDNLYPYLN